MNLMKLRIAGYASGVGISIQPFPQISLAFSRLCLRPVVNKTSTGIVPLSRSLRYLIGAVLTTPSKLLDQKGISSSSKSSVPPDDPCDPGEPCELPEEAAPLPAWPSIVILFATTSVVCLLTPSPSSHSLV